MLRLRPYVRSDAESVVKWFPDEFAMHQWCADGFSSFPLQPEEINAQYEARQNL